MPSPIGGVSAAPSRPAGNTTIFNSIDSLADRVKALAGVVDDILQRIEPIMLQVPPGPGAQGGSTSGPVPAVPVAARLAEIEADVEALRERVRVAYTRIEL